MKKIILIIILLVGSKGLSAQSYMNLTTYQDTANYLIHEVEMKKNLFKNKPFQVLLDSLKVAPIQVIEGSNKNEDLGKELIFDFNFESEFNNVHFIIVKFQSVPSYSTLYSVFYPKSNRNLTQILNLYKTLIVTDVLVKDYTNDEPQRPGITDNSNL